MECFICNKLGVSLSNETTSVLNLTSTDLELLKRRLCNLITDERVYDIGSICKVHKDKYLKFYQLNQRTCCDPFNRHPNKIRRKSLKSISLNLSMTNPVLIPGKKLCINCFSSLHSPLSEAESQILTPERKNDSDEDFCESTIMIDQLNKSCEALDVSPIKVSKFSSKRKVDYMQAKVKKLCKCVSTKASAVIGVDNISNSSKTKDMICPDCMSMMQNLSNKFTNASLKEKIQILTLVPNSWTIQQTKTYFNTTEYLVKKARKLKATEGVLSMPCDKKGAKLSSETVKKVITFYYNDDNSRICPGKKDCISIASENGRVLKQKRLILYNLKELYYAFKEGHKDLKIGLSKFCSLRPQECVTAGSKGIHSVCVCIYHENIKLMLHALHIHDYTSLLEKLVCSTESENCMVHRCDNCPSSEILKEELMHSNELEMINEISYKQWMKTDGAELKTIIMSVDEFVENLVAKLSTLCTHHFFTKAQSKFFSKTKDELREDTAIILADFSENYTCIVQDAIQSVHWKKEQVTIHPFLAYVKDNSQNKLKTLPMCVISDHLVHDTTTFWTFQKIIVHYLIQEVPKIKYIKYFSDGSSAQYKNFKNFINLCYHEKDHGVKAEWHFFASCHGKSACDGIGGTIKRMATKASLQRPYKDQLLNASDVYKFTKDSITGIKTFFVEKSEVETSHRQLALRYQIADTIKGTRSNHSFVPINETQLLVSRVSGSTTTFIATLGSKTIPLVFQNEQYVACIYGINWWIGKIVECCDEYNDYKIMFMHPHGPSTSYMWPKHLDVCWIPYEHIMKIVSVPSTSTGRTYKITTVENHSIELLFKNFKVD